MIKPPLTLLLRLAGPMQSWGTQSRFDSRDSEREPTKSGVVGLICAALGKPRDDSPGPWPSLAALAGLRMGVLVLSEGKLRSEYQTAGGGKFNRRSRYGVWRASGSVGETVVSRRHYLAGADFLVGLEGPVADLERIYEAVVSPVWQLSLGRKSYVPSFPVNIPDGSEFAPALRECSLEDALRAFPPKKERRRLVLEVPLGGAPETRMDTPVSFLHRTFSLRGIATSWLEVPHGS